MERGPILLLTLGAVTALAGILRFVHLGHFTALQAVYCLVSIPAALVVLLVCHYTLHHARIVLVMVLAFLALLAIASPSFCVGLGAALMGVAVAQGRL